jgi:hypothetical protein
MKTINRLFISAILMMAGIQLAGQCEPDTVNCKDIDEPGQICPRYLPDATYNESYEAVITVIPPDMFYYNENPIYISYLVLDSVSNMPEGLSYQSNADKFWADSAYCILISGTPTEEGEFPLSIYVTPWVKYGESNLPYQQVKDDTSVIMTVLSGSSGIDPFISRDFSVAPVFPNPYTEAMQIRFFTPVADNYKLEIFSILGASVYREVLIAEPGENSFIFNGSALKAGSYFYKVFNRSTIYTGKFIKAKR